MTTRTCAGTRCGRRPAGNSTRWGGERLFHPVAALAAPPTRNRLELSNNRQTRCHKLPHDPRQSEALLGESGARYVPPHAREIVLDLDAMGHRLHGGQEGRHFNAHDDDYVYLPRYAFVGSIPLWAQLRTSDRGAAHGVLPAPAQMVKALRRRWPQPRIIVRAAVVSARRRSWPGASANRRSVTVWGCRKTAGWWSAPRGR